MFANADAAMDKLVPFKMENLPEDILKAVQEIGKSTMTEPLIEIEEDYSQPEPEIITENDPNSHENLENDEFKEGTVVWAMVSSKFFIPFLYKNTFIG